MLRSQHPIQIINECGCLVSEDDLRAAILWHAKKPVMPIKPICLYKGYPVVNIHKQRFFVHVLLFMYWNQRRVRIGYVVHHKDKNRLNATRDNLVELKHGKHASLHNANKTQTVEHRRKIGEANRRRKGIHHRIVRTDIKYDLISQLLDDGLTIRAASRLLSCSDATVRRRIRFHDHDAREGAGG
jgi:hypothetical protein